MNSSKLSLIAIIVLHAPKFSNIVHWIIESENVNMSMFTYMELPTANLCCSYFVSEAEVLVRVMKNRIPKTSELWNCQEALMKKKSTYSCINCWVICKLYSFTKRCEAFKVYVTNLFNIYISMMCLTYNSTLTAWLDNFIFIYFCSWLQSNSIRESLWLCMIVTYSLNMHQMHHSYNFLIYNDFTVSVYCSFQIQYQIIFRWNLWR